MYKKELTREDKLVMELTGKYMDAKDFREFLLDVLLDYSSEVLQRCSTTDGLTINKKTSHNLLTLNMLITLLN